MYASKSLSLPLALAAALTLAAGCSNPNKVEELDPTINQKGTFQGAKVGVTKDDEAVVQTEKEADQELRETDWGVYDLEQKLKTDHEGLTKCREELADPRLGGNGEVAEIPDIDNMKPTTEVREEMGLTPKGELKIIKKEGLMDKLSAARKYKEKLDAMVKTVKKHRTTCEREYSAARVRAGLPAKRYESVGRHQGGTYVQERAPERNLDDAFRIASEEASKAKKKARKEAREEKVEDAKADAEAAGAQ